jgi:hypothetical protein
MAHGQNSSKLLWSCPYGTIREMTAFGMQALDNMTCMNNIGSYLGEPDVDNDHHHPKDLSRECGGGYQFTPEGKQNFTAAFNESCYDKPECTLVFNTSWFTDQCRRRFEYYALGSKFPQYATENN